MSETTPWSAPEPITVTDKRGRRLTMRKIDSLGRLRLFEAAGPALSENNPYMGMAVTAACITNIDGIPVPFPTTKPMLEATVERVGDEGRMEALKAFFTEKPDATADAIKN